MDLTRKLELAWAAGFFDGEGHFGTKKDKKSRGATAFVSQIEPYPLERMRTALGIGRIYGPINASPDTKRRWPNAKPYWKFAITNFEHVQAAGAMMWNWLSPTKRAQFVDTIKRTSPKGLRTNQCEAIGHRVVRYKRTSALGHPYNTACCYTCLSEQRKRKRDAHRQSS